MSVVCYTYDALYRLIAASGREQINNTAFPSSDNWDDNSYMVNLGGDATRTYTQNFVYDAVGNILSLQHSAGTGSYTRSYAYGTTSNRLNNTTIGTQSPVPEYDYVYDVRGNMTQMAHLSVINWNATNELSSLTQGTTNAYYQYSGGQRIRKYADKGSGNIKEERIYLGNYEIYRRFDGSGSLTFERDTVHISDDTGRIAMHETFDSDIYHDSTTPDLIRYIYSDQLQSASVEIDDGGDLLTYEEYHPYGTTSYQMKDPGMQAAAKRYRYTGKERDEESGLYYHGARYYIPWLGRWTACDPLESKYAPQSPYVYCSDNPIIRTDATGMGDDDPKGSWISTPTKMAYNSAIDGEDMSEVRKIYGNDATIRNVGYSYVTGGDTIVLGPNGSFTDNGKQKQSVDDAAFNGKEAAKGWFQGFGSNIVATLQHKLSFRDLYDGLGETSMSLFKLSNIVNHDSPFHKEAIENLKDDFSTFSKTPSYGQGKVVGNYSAGIAENVALSYIMGTAAPKMPMGTAATFEESFPGWYATRPAIVTEGVNIEGAVWAQKTFSGTFSAGGKFAGQTVEGVAGSLRNGTLSVTDVPIDVVERNGQTFILNTRSSAALMQANIPRSAWNVVNQTGVSSFENMLTGQLERNRLINGTNTIRQSGTQLILSH